MAMSRSKMRLKGDNLKKKGARLHARIERVMKNKKNRGTAMSLQIK